LRRSTWLKRACSLSPQAEHSVALPACSQSPSHDTSDSADTRANLAQDMALLRNTSRFMLLAPSSSRSRDGKPSARDRLLVDMRSDLIARGRRWHSHEPRCGAEKTHCEGILNMAMPPDGPPGTSCGFEETRRKSRESPRARAGEKSECVRMKRTDEEHLTAQLEDASHSTKFNYNT